MASDKYEIDFNGVSVRVPAWATTEQIDEITKIDEASLRVLTALLKDNKMYTNKTLQNNRSLLDRIEEGTKATVRGSQESIKQGRARQKQQEEAQKQQERLFRKQIEEMRKQKQKEADAEKRFYDKLNSAADNLKGSAAGLVKGINKVDLQGIATAIGGIDRKSVV